MKGYGMLISPFSQDQNKNAKYKYNQKYMIKTNHPDI
jgi:hypothetical protein